MQRAGNIFFIIFLCFQFLEAFGQETTINAKIESIETRQPIGYATIAIKSTNKGTYANHEGKFALSGLNQNDTLVISSVGYSSQEVPLSSFITFKENVFYMNPKIYELNEVVVKPSSTSEETTLGFNKTSIQPGMVQVIFPDKFTFAHATYQSNPNQVNGYVKEVSIKLSSYDSEGDSIVFRVNLHAFDNQKRIPANLLLEKDFIVYWKRGQRKTLAVSLEEFNILLPKNGFYIVVQCLGSFDPQGKRIFGSIGYKFSKTKTKKPFSCSRNFRNEWTFDMIYNRKEDNYQSFNVWSLIDVY